MSIRWKSVVRCWLRQHNLICAYDLVCDPVRGLRALASTVFAAALLLSLAGGSSIAAASATDGLIALSDNFSGSSMNTSLWSLGFIESSSVHPHVEVVQVNGQ